MRRPGPDETLAHAGGTEAGRTVVLTPLGHGLVARPGPHGEAPLAIGGNIVVRITGADGAGAVRWVVVTVDLAPVVSGRVARPGPRPSTRVSSWNWRCNNTSLRGGALSNSLSCTFIILSGLIIVVILLSHGGDTLANNGNVCARLKGLDCPTGPVTRAPVPAIPVGPLEHALVTRPHRETELGRDLVGSHRVRDPELGVSSLNHGQSGISLVKTLLSWILIYVVISTQTNLNITLKHNVSWTYKTKIKVYVTAWFAVMCDVTVMTWPGWYCRTMTPLANLPPGASCSFTTASQASPHMPHLPPMAELH